MGWAKRWTPKEREKIRDMAKDADFGLFAANLFEKS